MLLAAHNVPVLVRDGSSMTAVPGMSVGVPRGDDGRLDSSASTT